MVRTPTKGATWKPWVPSISHMETWRRPAQNDHGENLPRQRRDRSRGRRQVNPGDLRPPNWSRLRPSGLLRKPGYLVERAPSTSPIWRPWPNGPQGQQLQDETSPAAGGPPYVSSARTDLVKGRKFRDYPSRLWRLAQKVSRPPTTPFAKLWKPLFLMLCVLCNVMIQKPGVGDTTVGSFF